MDCSLLYVSQFLFLFIFFFTLVSSNFLLLSLVLSLFSFLSKVFSFLTGLPCWGLRVFGVWLSQLGFEVWNVIIIIICSQSSGSLPTVQVWGRWNCWGPEGRGVSPLNDDGAFCYMTSKGS